MQIHPGTLNRFINAEYVFERVKGCFSDFQTALDTINDQRHRSQVKGIVSECVERGQFTKIRYGSVVIGLRLLLVMPQEESAKGVVVCTLEEPQFEAHKPILGSFTFNGGGYTDIEHEEGADRIHMEQNAFWIILEFLSMALGRPIPADQTQP
ncbi:hypothetical protein [Ideonella sp.]|uniref:hypothetical protein n=1 Tax=Ideonella sp. TaxID=1929293 RepID=UPI003BB7F909